MKLWKLIMTGVVTLGLAGVFVTAPTPVTAQASDGVSIDGDFSDWKDAKLTEGYKLEDTTAIASNGQYVDIYVSKDGSSLPTDGNYMLTVDGKQYYLTPKGLPGSLKEGDTNSFNLDAGVWPGDNKYGEVGSGYASSVKSRGVGEFRIDLTKLGLTKSVDGKTVSINHPAIGNTPSQTKIDWSGAASDSSDKTDSSSSSASSSSIAASGGVINGKKDESSKGTTPTDSNANNDNDNLNIRIDGKFADWKDVKLTDGYNGYTAMVSDGDHVYIYVKMKYSFVPGHGDYIFETGGKTFHVWSQDMPEHTLAKGDTKAVTFIGGNDFDGHSYGEVGNGYVTCDSDGHSIAEFKVDLSKFDLSTMTGQTITMYNPNIGNTKVSVAGGSTGPYILSGIGLAIAGLGYLKFRKSGKAKHKDDPTLTK